MFAFILELLSTTSTGWSSKIARESEREGGRGTDGLLTSLRRSWRVLDASDEVKAEISGGGR